MLELRGHKAKVFAALNPGELALYKSEQVRRAGRAEEPAWPILAPHRAHLRLHQAFSLGIGICFIELQGCSVRETKSRSFDLLTPHRCFRWGLDLREARWGEGQGCKGWRPLQQAVSGHALKGVQWARVKLSRGPGLAHMWPLAAPTGMVTGMGHGGRSMPTDWLSTPQLHSRVWGGSAELGDRSAGSSNRDPV